MPSASLRICGDRIAPHSPTILLPDGRLAGLHQNFWPPHQRTLHVRFLGGDPRVHKRIEWHASTWMKFANIKFIFDNDPKAFIRIGFESGASWSFVGTDALDPTIEPDEPTMNFGWFTAATPNDELQRVVLHEFGHALGMIHEHQSPAADIPWDRDAVISYFAGPPNFWSVDQVESNIFQRYSHDTVNASVFDRASVMLYPIPPEFTGGKLSVGWNRTLSPTDRAFIQTVYPPAGQ